MYILIGSYILDNLSDSDLILKPIKACDDAPYQPGQSRFQKYWGQNGPVGDTENYTYILRRLRSVRTGKETFWQRKGKENN